MHTVDANHNFWSQQTSSLHRRDSQNFYKKKADEHASVMTAGDCQDGALDLACGAGELLQWLLPLVKYETAIDFSASMLEQAKRNLPNSNVEFFLGDVYQYLPSARQSVWTTTGGLNQYLNDSDQLRLLDIFVENSFVRSFYMFDTVDPLRYYLMPHGISYRPEHARESRLFPASWLDVARCLRRVRYSGRLVAGLGERDCRKLNSPGMGWAYLPRFWLKAAEVRGLECEVVSSRYYEYRYHVLLKKRAQPHVKS
jgi:cyclopropane-fatty-acyl-phospholipid synthase